MLFKATYNHVIKTGSKQGHIEKASDTSDKESVMISAENIDCAREMVKAAIRTESERYNIIGQRLFGECATEGHDAWGNPYEEYDIEVTRDESIA